MSRYGGWCNSCSCNSCDCSCGRKTVLQQSRSSCCSSSSSSKFCKEPVVYLTSNFTVPAANVEVEITVSNSAKLYLGQGIMIGDFFFQITEIVDSVTINIAHNGTATPAATLTALSATYACYQYPIYYAGAVDLLTVPTVTGLDDDYVLVTSSVLSPVAELLYSFLGPKKVQFELSVKANINNTPAFIAVDVPVATSLGAGTIGYGTFSSLYNPGTGYIQGVSFIIEDQILIGIGAGAVLTDGDDQYFRASGVYDL